jgi:hypothetical protein
MQKEKGYKLYFSIFIAGQYTKGLKYRANYYESRFTN